ncbi:MAG: pro-sigmaK processing inhibitor BofA family protein [Bacilli bacterium]|nr:pro-sigmaK processing inhibitor BofA family protein [Bacilli bacterium]
MLKSILKIIKKIIISIIVLYGYNMVTQSFNLNIPINIITVAIMTIFDGSGFLGLVTFYLLNFR